VPIRSAKLASTSRRVTIVKSLAALLAASALITGGCTVVKIGKGDTNTITHAPGAEKDLTSRACRRAGNQNAEIISTVNEDASLPAGTGKQVTTFRCLSTKPQPQT
jgi:hypothetical protein